MAEYIFVNFVDAYDGTDPNIVDGSPEVKALIEKQIINIIKLSSFIKFSVMRTIVTCPVSANKYFISFSFSPK